MKIAKEFKWEMGHRLPEHFGQCKNIHGHSYKMLVEIEGELNKDEMVIDYYDIEKIVNPIIEKIDHAFMVNKKDKEVLEFLEKMNSKKVVVDFQSTAENICLYLLNEIRKVSLPQNVSEIKVRVYETAHDYAEDSIKIG
ncbi:MAG: 6-carboxytetrahydropterin synthase [Ignavibacteriaceae bacterium]|jgi:6-pyruvoyltetrahydropterin/6-carboxytetrahydropterin synthase|nr:6-carboxytetrahydropterin synthase [Ignavibacteriaceae bacterium]MCW8813816.1 6-carboxytetrahydropterin synthase [Chlorobium sp.]MCW8995018.1 6-carboxytetrahydropterin synthase [Psychromonas sp.]MCW8817087.1 6-carboxytetrahydropterin synthase [Ignavibacteriaceae bacterium]MCW8824347.1 6-carboxytetrahydropterin synthase [Ignavibacteriaceae bacterium]